MSAAAQSVASPARPEPAAWRELARLVPYLAPYKKATVQGLLTLAAMGLVGAVPPLVIGAIIDLLGGASRPLPNLRGFWRAALSPVLRYYAPRSLHALWILALLLVAAVAIKGVFSYASRWILIGISRDIEYDLRNDLLARLVQMEPAFYVRNPTGELMSRCTNDLSQVRMVLGPGIMYSGNTIVNMAMAVALMAQISPLLTVEVLIPVPIVALAVRYFGNVIHDLQTKVQEMLAALSARAQENLAGVRVVRAYAEEESEMQLFDQANRCYVGQNVKMIRAWSMFFPALQFIIGFSFVLVLWAGSRMVVQDRISLGALIAFYTYVGQLVFPMIALGWVTNIFQRGAASMARLNYILDAEPAIRDAGSPAPVGDRVEGEIEFRNLTFAYPMPRAANGASPLPGRPKPDEVNPPVLRDISLRIPAGSTVAIVGPTGSGKSTLAALIARLWEAPPDTVFIDGLSIRDWPLQKLRRAIGFVPQDAFLFSDTIRGNVAYGIQEIPPGAVEDAARIASVSSDISEFPAGYDTVVGERGITLSGGQKQRTTLARALIRDPRILVLDDAFSSVDTDTEEKILEGLEDVFRHRTTILISHRCSTVRDADRIFVLRDGRVEEQGSHAELIGRGGYYAELYQKQLLEEELARE